MQLKVLGSTFILMGTAIGAGMLALPLVSGAAGFNSEWIMIAMWAVMTLTALMVLEVTLAFKTQENSFSTMAKATLGRPGQIIAWVIILLLLYSLTSAYIAGDASLLTMMTHQDLGWPMPHWVNALVFTLIFGGAVFWSTRAVDIFNRGLISIKGIALILAIVLLVPHIDFVKLVEQPHHSRYLWGVAPIFMTAFGFHTVIPSLANYLNKDVKALRKVVIWGATIPLILYSLWLVVALGIVPFNGAYSFASIAQHHGSVGMLTADIDHFIHSRLIIGSVDTFSNIAMTTSFLGVTLGLFDFLADGFKQSNSHGGRFVTALLTFIPPLVFAIFYPNGFILALNYASLAVAILLIVMPPLMAYQLRKSTILQSPYRLWGGNTLLMLILLIGIFMVVLSILSNLHLLPVMV